MQPDDGRVRPPPQVSSSREREIVAQKDAPSLHGAALRLERGVDGKLWLHGQEGASPVDVVRCFPWTEPHRFLSLRDAEGRERAFVRDTGELDSASRAALDATLRRSSFVFQVLEILSVAEDFELRSWRVRTAQGERSFQTALDAWPRALPGGSLVLEDVHGDLYRVPAPAELDRNSRKLLWAFVD